MASLTSEEKQKIIEEERFRAQERAKYTNSATASNQKGKSILYKRFPGGIGCLLLTILLILAFVIISITSKPTNQSEISPSPTAEPPRTEEQLVQKNQLSPTQEYIAEIKDINDLVTESFSVIGPIFLNKPDTYNWTRQEKSQISVYSEAIMHSYRSAAKLTPPSEYQKFHTIWVQALKKYSDAMPLMREGADEINADKLNQASSLINDGKILLEQSTVEFEKVSP